MQNLELQGCESCKQIDCLINKYCSQKWKPIIGNAKLFREYAPHQVIFYEGDIVSRIHFIRQGKVKISNTTHSGTQNIIRLAGSGEMLGLRAFTEDLYVVNATTLEPTSICSIDKKVFLKVLWDSSEFMMHLLEFYAHQYSSLEMQHRQFSRAKSKGKIARALLLIKKQYGIINAENECLLDVVLSRQELADIGGTCLAEAIRALSVFKKEKIIKIYRQKIILLDEKKLNKYIFEKV